jgi:zinc protease
MRLLAPASVALLAVFAGSCIATAVRPVTGNVVAYPSIQATLSSGTRAAFELAPDFGVAGVVLVMGAGSVDDPKGKEGLAHLVEHLVFHSRHDHDVSYRRKLQVLGAGSWNAMTTWDSTTYYAFGPTASLPDLMALVAGVADAPLADVDENAFEHERAVVLEELRSHAEDGTPSQIVGLVDAATFPAEHPYSRSVIGTAESISGLTLADAVAFAKANYRPARAVLTSAGPVPSAEQRSFLQKVADRDGWPQAAPELRAPSSVPLDGSAPRSSQIESHELPVSTPSLWIGWSIPAQGSPEAEAAMVVARMVKGAFAEHVYDHDPDVAIVDAEVDLGAVSGVFYVKATLREGSHPRDSASSLLATMMHGLGERTYQPQLFDIYKQLVATDLLGEEQSMPSRTLRVARSVALTGSPTFLRERADRTASLSPDRVANFYRRYLTNERAHAVLVAPMPPTFATAATPPAPEDPIVDLGAAAIPTQVHDWMQPPNLDLAQRTTLPNGMAAVVLPRGGSPFHSLIVAYHGGRGMERRQGAAIASTWAREHIFLTSSAWTIAYRTGLSRDSTYELLGATGADIGLTLRRLDQAHSFRVFWPPDELSSRLDVLAKEDQAPDSVFDRTLDERFFGHHPYGIPTTAAALRAVAPNDVYKYIDAIERPANGIAVVVGDVASAQTIQQLAADVGRGEPAPRKEVPIPPPLESVEAPPGGRLFVVNRPGSDTAKVAFRCALPAATSDDWGKTEVFANLMGSNLLTELRYRTATSYGVSNNLVLLRGGTTFLAIAADVDHGHLPIAIAALRHFVAGAPASLVDASALTVARATTASQFNLRFGTPHDLAEAIVQTWNRDWPLATIDEFPGQVEATRIEDLTRLLDHCQHNWILGILGDEARIRTAIGAWHP